MLNQGTLRLVIPALPPYIYLKRLNFIFTIWGLIFFFFFVFLPFLGQLPWHMEVPRLGVETEL